MAAKIQFTDKKAIYINGRRVTGRETKWGVHNIVFEAKVDEKEILAALESYRTRTGIDLRAVSEKLAAGTHVLVPVEPTPEMCHASTMIAPTWDDKISAEKYRAMIRAAK